LGEERTLRNLIKLSGNFLIAAFIESWEATALADKGGVDLTAT
jgi:hypothetical protein